ncbi:MAG: DUF6629 family protein [Longimicrobiales bacterium]
MCFSATASFVAGGSLSAIGAATITKAERRSELPLATIPLLFGIQQIVEGVIWLTFRHDMPLLKHTMTNVYSVFSHVLWPIYVPFAIGFLDSTPWRKRTLLGFQAAGIVVGLYLLYSLVTRPIVAQVVGRHIAYVSPHFYLLPVMVLYLAATCVSCFFSSHKFVILFGVLGLVSFIASYLVHASALVSIWCFFYAILSLLIYVHLRYRGLGGFPEADSRTGPGSLAGEVVGP